MERIGTSKPRLPVWNLPPWFCAWQCWLCPPWCGSRRAPVPTASQTEQKKLRFNQRNIPRDRWQVTGRWVQRHWNSVRWWKKYFVLQCFTRPRVKLKWGLRISSKQRIRRFSSRAPSQVFSIYFIDFVHLPARLHLFKWHPNAQEKNTSYWTD